MPIAAFRDGIQRVILAPVVVAGAILVAFLTALPLGWLTGPPGARASSDPWLELHGLGAGLLASRAGVAELLLSLGPLLDPLTHPAGLALLTLYGAGWTILSGGIIDRLARDRATYAPGFFSACGLFGVRLLRLGTLSLFLHLAWLRLLPASGFERGADLWQVVASGLGLASVGLILDYARVRAVVEDRRSMLGAVLAALRIIKRHPAGCVLLYLLNGLLVVGVITLWGLVPPPTTATPSLTLFGLVGVYLTSRVVARLLFYGVEVAYFQSQLAHAGYVARPTPRWPESASVEALARLR